MPSPFPGMDPYLESPEIWGDVHTSLYAAMRADLNSRLPKGYVARFDLYVWVHEPDARTRRLGEPDFYVAHSGAARERPGGAGMVAAPRRTILPAVVREEQKFLKIIDTQGRRVVTVVEILSPANKTAGPGRDSYLAKRDEYRATGTNLVEIDLLRSGQRPPLGTDHPRSDYYVLVSCHWEAPAAAIWEFGVRDPLPEVPIPLTPAEQPVTVSLRACLDRAWTDARYDEDLDYNVPPDPPLPPADAAWAAELVARPPRR